MIAAVRLTFLACFILCIFSCKGEPRIPEGSPVVNLTNTTSQLVKVNFYLENSGSMDGYTKDGYTAFEKAISDLLTNLVQVINKESLQVYLANNEEFPWNDSYENFLENLIKNGIPKIGNVSESDINRIFENVLDNTKEGSVSVLVTDAIYSVEPDNCKDLIGLLDTKGKFTGNSFFDRISVYNLSTLMIKLQSNFNGNYYPAEGGTKVISQFRPYYVWFFGESSHLKQLYDKLEIPNLPGYQNDQFFLKTQKIEVPYSIFEYGEESGIIGKYEPTDSHEYPIHSINFDHKEKFGDNQDKFGFGVLADLSRVPLPEKYILDPSNYYCTSEEYGVYSIVNIKTITDKNTLEDLQNQEKQTGHNYTHIIYLRTEEKVIQEFSVGIQNQISQWIMCSTNNCDTNIEGDTDSTFGLEQLCSGIIEAYENASPSTELVTLQISIKT